MQRRVIGGFKQTPTILEDTLAKINDIELNAYLTALMACERGKSHEDQREQKKKLAAKIYERIYELHKQREPNEAYLRDKEKDGSISMDFLTEGTDRLIAYKEPRDVHMGCAVRSKDGQRGWHGTIRDAVLGWEHYDAGGNLLARTMITRDGTRYDLEYADTDDHGHWNHRLSSVTETEQAAGYVPNPRDVERIGTEVVDTIQRRYGMHLTDEQNHNGWMPGLTSYRYVGPESVLDEKYEDGVLVDQIFNMGDIRSLQTDNLSMERTTIDPKTGVIKTHKEVRDSKGGYPVEKVDETIVPHKSIKTVVEKAGSTRKTERFADKDEHFSSLGYNQWERYEDAHGASEVVTGKGGAILKESKESKVDGTYESKIYEAVRTYGRARKFRFSRSIDANGNTTYKTFDGDGKPVTIMESKDGSVRISYDEQGELKNIRVRKGKGKGKSIDLNKAREKGGLVGRFIAKQIAESAAKKHGFAARIEKDK